MENWILQKISSLFPMTRTDQIKIKFLRGTEAEFYFPWKQTFCSAVRVSWESLEVMLANDCSNADTTWACKYIGKNKLTKIIWAFTLVESWHCSRFTLSCSSRNSCRSFWISKLAFSSEMKEAEEKCPRLIRDERDPWPAAKIFGLIPMQKYLTTIPTFRAGCCCIRWLSPRLIPLVRSRNWSWSLVIVFGVVSGGGRSGLRLAMKARTLLGLLLNSSTRSTKLFINNVSSITCKHKTNKHQSLQEQKFF